MNRVTIIWQLSYMELNAVFDGLPGIHHMAAEVLCVRHWLVSSADLHDVLLRRHHRRAEFQVKRHPWKTFGRSMAYFTVNDN